MALQEKMIDDYIAQSADFAKPILHHIRALVHKACPDVEEKIKWRMPFFIYHGDIICHMAAFKKHAIMAFWKAPMMKDPILIENAKSETAMGHLGKLTSLKTMPSDKKIIGWIRESMKLTDSGIKPVAKTKSKINSDLTIPDYFQKALTKNKKALEVFNNFPPSHKKEYLMWIKEAKTDNTRNKRMETALEWIAAGKGRNWKYESKQNPV